MVIFLLAIASYVIVSYVIIEFIVFHNVKCNDCHPVITEMRKTKAYFRQPKCIYCGTVLRTKILLKGRCVSCGANLER